MAEIEALDVFVADQRVGVLERFDDESQRFSWADSYLQMPRQDRRVLGQIFEDRIPEPIYV
ncbi:MAG: hypothetical protein MI861_21490, partial [Pirellulales bacterium]|nr:hypothetical protein [Pirellulales bacterium]